MAGRAREIPCPPGTAEPSVWPSQGSRQPQWGAGLPCLGQWDHSLPGMLSLLPPFLLLSSPPHLHSSLCPARSWESHLRDQADENALSQDSRTRVFTTVAPDSPTLETTQKSTESPSCVGILQSSPTAENHTAGETDELVTHSQVSPR